MKKFRIIEYIKKYQIIIVVISLLAGGFFYRHLLGKQSYTASAVIQYTNYQAEEGLAPDNTEIDTSDIYSVQVMTEVFKRMGLSYGAYNLDDFRSRVSVKEVITEEMQTVQEAMNATGEIVKTRPTKYIVSFTATPSDSTGPGEFARQVLDNILDVYLSSYGEKHVANVVAYNSVSGIDQTNFDYIETIETIENAIQDTLEKLDKKVQASPEFRAAANGYSFSDLYKKFYLLENVKVSNIYAQILNNKVTKDKEVLLAKYQNRIQKFLLNNNASQSDIDGVEEIIASYVRMMRESGNTELTYESILQEVQNSAYKDDNDFTQYHDQTVEYDKLMKSYINNRTSYEHNLIDAAYCQYILDIYQGVTSSSSGVDIDITEQENAYIGSTEDSEQEEPDAKPAETDTDTAVQPEENTGEGTDTGKESAGDAAGADTLENAGGEARTQELLNELIAEADKLYDELEVTSQEYYDYSGSQNVRVMTNIIVNANIRVLFYAAIVVLLIAVLCCVLAVVAGRLEDIFDYYILRDSKTGLPNRAGCDKYMASYASKLLPENFAAISIRLLGIKEKNTKYGRETCDRMMVRFAETLQNIFPQTENCFIALNAMGQFLIFCEDMPKEHVDTYKEALRSAVTEHNKGEDCLTEYEIGTAESKDSDTYRIKILMMHAMRDMHPEITTAQK